MSAAEPIRTIAVLGGGIVGHAAAIAFRRSLPEASVTLIEIPAAHETTVERIGVASDRIHDFHRQIGLPSQLFANDATATPRFGTRFIHGARDWTVSEGGGPTPYVDGIALHQLWLRHERTTGHPIAPWHDVAPCDDRRGAFFDPARYRELLGRLARHIGVTVLSTESWSAEHGEHGIAALRLGDGGVIEADLYADCTGHEAGLIGSLSAELVPWGAYLPRLGLSDHAAGHAAHKIDTLTIDQGRIAWEVGAQRLSFEADDQAPMPGHRPESWTGNVVAFGEAAFIASPSAQLLPAVLDDILRAIRFLPHRGGDPLARAEYNRRTRMAHTHMLDWSAAMWLLPQDSERPLPPGLAHLLSQFRARGRIPFRDGDMIAASDWIAMLIGLGIRPERIDPTALVPDDAQCRGLLERLLAGSRGGRVATG